MQIWETDNQEAENKRKALIITILVNVLLLIAIYFIVVWKEQIPPLPTYGMELNLGFTDQGSGNNQTNTPASETLTSNTESAAPGEQASKPVESSVPVSEPKTESSKPKSSLAKTTYESQSKAPSPIKASEKSSTASKDPSPAKKEQTPVTQPSTAEAEKTTTKATEKPKTDPRARYGAGGTSGSSSTKASGSAQGSSTTKGDEGKPTGNVDKRGLMGSGSGEGSPGPASGIEFEIAGWAEGLTPNLDYTPADRNGIIIFEVTVNDQGRIVNSQLLPGSNTNMQVVSFYKKKLEEFKLKKTSNNQVQEFSKGKIIFKIQMN